MVMMRTVRDIFYSSLWILPFLSFIAGYQLVRALTHTEKVRVPSVVGLHMNEAIKLLSADLLNVRILAEKEDPDLHEGTILSQTPEAGLPVKTHQSIFLVITKRPPKARAPQLRGLTCEQAQAKAVQAGIILSTVFFENPYPQDRVIAQSVIPEREVPHKSMMIYCSAGTTPLRIFPDLRGRTVEETVAFFNKYSGTVHIQGNRAEPIKEQQPRAGSLIDIRKPLVVEVVCSAL